MQNTRRAWRLQAFGEVHGLFRWAEIVGVHPETLKHRICVLEWPAEVALIFSPRRGESKFMRALRLHELMLGWSCAHLAHGQSKALISDLIRSRRTA